MEIGTIARLGAFLGVFAIMALWEIIAPKRKQVFSKPIRFANNLGLMAINTIILRFIFPMGAVGFAIWCQPKTIGIFNIIKIPFLIEIIITLTLLDLIIYLQHLIFHKVPIFWRIHKVHHADPEIDVSTAGRFHIFEIIISMGIKLVCIAIIGAEPIAVLMFEIVLNACAMFNHSNIAIPTKIDAILRRLMVTPDMHRIHHSNNPREFNSNFGFNIALWDRVFNTYTEEPKLGQSGLIIGQSENMTNRDLWIDRLFFRVFKP